MRAPALAIAVSVLAAACAPALREPPTVAALAGKPAAAPDGAPPRDLVAEAEEAFARRPSFEDARRAESLFLQAAAADPDRVDGIIGAVRTKAWLAEHETDGKVREQLAVSAVQIAQWCGRRAPGSAACDYWLAVALGLQARERPSTADSALKEIIPALERAAKASPELDFDGPDRVLALVYCRAPGWPLGPGDPESGLDAARRAVSRYPDYPPNALALAEALKKNGDVAGGMNAYAKALDLARARGAAGDPDAADWEKEALRGLGR